MAGDVAVGSLLEVTVCSAGDGDVRVLVDVLHGVVAVAATVRSLGCVEELGSRDPYAAESMPAVRAQILHLMARRCVCNHLRW